VLPSASAVQRPGLRGAAAAVLLLLLVSLAPVSARAHGSGGSTLPAEVPAVTDEGKRARAILDALKPAASPAPSPGQPAPPAAPADVQRSIETARTALSRCHGAHLAGDTSGARRLGRVALAWAEAAKAQLTAAAAERAGAAIEKAAADLATRRVRASAMLVEAQARKGQLGAQIAQKKAAIDAAKAPPPESRAKNEKKPAPKKAGAP
jgi:colicin import membrane protein